MNSSSLDDDDDFITTKETKKREPLKEINVKLKKRRKVTPEVQKAKVKDHFNKKHGETGEDFDFNLILPLNVDNLTAMMDQGKPQSPLKKKIILVSGWNDKEPDVAAAVDKLGNADVLECTNYDETVTHMITTKVSRYVSVISIKLSPGSRLFSVAKATLQSQMSVCLFVFLSFCHQNPSTA